MSDTPKFETLYQAVAATDILMEIVFAGQRPSIKGERIKRDHASKALSDLARKKDPRQRRGGRA